MTTLVIDASVAIKWVVQEQESDSAHDLLRHRLLAPDLILAECANILWKKVQRRELSAGEAIAAARTLADSDVEHVPMRGLIEEATRLAIEIGHPAYDCMYLALAVLQDCAFITADRKLVQKVAATSMQPHIIALSQP